MTLPHGLSRRTLLGGALLGLAAGSAVTALAPAVGADDDDELEGEGYALDDIERKVAERGPLVCPKVELEHHRGTHLRYTGMATVYAGFRLRLEKMEQVALEVGERFYGRPPRRLRHIGTLSCRRIRGYPGWISEHGLGNAIDLEGFDFGALPKDAALPDGAPKVFRHAFGVRVLSHWKPAKNAAAYHAEFLRALADELIARQDIFRVLLGPGYPGHWNHFHLDCAPFRMVEGF
jgi:hypothetical protein